MIASFERSTLAAFRLASRLTVPNIFGFNSPAELSTLSQTEPSPVSRHPAGINMSAFKSLLTQMLELVLAVISSVMRDVALKHQRSIRTVDRSVSDTARVLGCESVRRLKREIDAVLGCVAIKLRTVARGPPSLRSGGPDIP
jgi:hypothetical protein